jgi:glyoxylase-like metal-dependent hydrolase (beta-lactamase superfamily II)
MIPLISNRVKFIEAPDRGRFPYAHSLFIDDEIRVLIDTACGEENIKYFLDHPPDIILNTHFHEDHIMNNHKFHSAQIWAHSLDAPAIRSEEVFFEFYGFHYFGAERIGRLFYEWTGAKPSPVHQELQGGQILDFGKTKVQLIHAPGHTPGHCCFLFEDDILFTADIELGSFGPWYGHWCSDIDDFIASIELCQEINPSIIVTSHRGIIKDKIQKRLQDYVNIIYRKEEKVLSSLKQQPMNLDQLTELQIYHGEIKEFFRLFKMWEKMAMHTHLKRLIKLGLVEKAEDCYYSK